MECVERQITSCEVCGSDALGSVLDLGAHPMCDDLVKIGQSRICAEFPIDILYCETCRTAHQRFQLPKRELFPWDYHYRSRQTADVLMGMRQLTEACDRLCGEVSGKSVLDIGCNDGSLLSIFAEFGARTYGIEPTGASADARRAGHVVIDAFLDEAVARAFVGRHGCPDIITFTNVFAHIEDLAEVIRALTILTGNATFVVIENHYLGAIIEKNQFDTFYHEHPRTYSFRSFQLIARALGMRLVHVEFPARYGGNIRVFMSRTGNAAQDSQHWAEIDAAESRFAGELARMAQSIDRWRARKLQEIEDAVRQHGPLRAKAFPGRSAIPIKLLGLDTGQISAVYEKPSSAKIGYYVPGTRIPIVSDDEFDAGAPGGPLINLAWHISGEIGSYMRSRFYQGPIIDIISASDFISVKDCG